MQSSLTSEQLHYFKSHLLAQRDELVQKIDQYEKQFTSLGSNYVDGELSTNDNHFADNATTMYEQERDRAFHDAQLRTLQRLDHALNRIDQQQYGICEVCNQPIALARLQAIPETSTCEEHAQHSEVALHYEQKNMGFEQLDNDHQDRNFYDGEDSLQDVLNYGNSSYGSNPLMMLDTEFAEEMADELVGYCEPLESFVATDITGNNVFIVRNQSYMNYMHSEEGDQELEDF